MGGRSWGKKPLLILLTSTIVGIAGLVVTRFLTYPENFGMSLCPLLALFGLVAGAGGATFSVGITNLRRVSERKARVRDGRVRPETSDPADEIPVTESRPAVLRSDGSANVQRQSTNPRELPTPRAPGAQSRQGFRSDERLSRSRFLATPV